MRIKLTLSNYRCFGEVHPATIEVGSGFTSFIGPNNSGKSTILKFFYEIRQTLEEVSGHPASRGHINGLIDGVVGANFPAHITDYSEVICERARSDFFFEIQVAASGEGAEIFMKSLRWTYNFANRQYRLQFKTSTDEILASGQAQNWQSTDDFFVVFVDKKYEYRTLFTAIGELAQIQYLGPFRNAINEGAGQYFDLALGTQFLAQWHHWKTGGEKSQNRAISKVTNDVAKLIGAKALEINASIELKTLQILIDGRPHKLSELGAGIAQLIVVLGNALIKRPTFIAIDEPETHLHPALQQEFLLTLASYAKHGVLFSTHSLGLCRAVSDRIYSVRPGADGSIVRPFEKTPRYAEFLGSMGIAGLEDIGWNTILLVEGPHDVRTFQQLLRAYQKDHGVIVLPLGGSSMINGTTAHLLAEVRRLCDRVFAVIDSEREAIDAHLAVDRAAFVQNCKSLDIKCHVTERRAVENYLTDRCIRDAFGMDYSALQPYMHSSAASWGKGESWRAARLLTPEELQTTDLGEFLAAL